MVHPAHSCSAYIGSNRRDLNVEVLNNKITFRDAFREMLESVKTPFEECKEILKKSEYSPTLRFK